MKKHLISTLFIILSMHFPLYANAQNNNTTLPSVVRPNILTMDKDLSPSNNDKNNPFIKRKNIPNTLPTGLPVNFANSAPTTFLKLDDRIDDVVSWNKTKVIGFIGNNIILRFYMKANTSDPFTILTSYNTPFLINQSNYSVVKNGTNFIIMDHYNKPYHRISFSNNTVKLLSTATNSSSSNSNSSGNTTNNSTQATNTQSGNGSTETTSNQGNLK